MTFGSSIPALPASQLTGALERAVEAYLAERGDAASLLAQILEGQKAATDQLAAACADVARAAAALAAQATAPAPVVNVTVPEVEVEAPVVNVTVPESQVEVLAAPAGRVKKTVVRGPDGLIDHVIEEPA